MDNSNKQKFILFILSGQLLVTIYQIVNLHTLKIQTLVLSTNIVHRVNKSSLLLVDFLHRKKVQRFCSCIK